MGTSRAAWLLCALTVKLNIGPFAQLVVVADKGNSEHFFSFLISQLTLFMIACILLNAFLD